MLLNTFLRPTCLCAMARLTFSIALLLGLCLMPMDALCDERDYSKSGVTVTASYSWKPYSFFDAAGNPSGFLVDFWKKWSEKTGVPVQFKLVTWGESLDLVAKGECDVQSGLYITDERERFFSFSIPVYHSRAVTFVRKSTSCSEDLSKVRWGGVLGTAELASLVKMYPEGDLVTYKDSFALFQGLADGEIQAAVDDSSTVLLIGRELGLSGELEVCETFYQRNLHAAIRKGNTELVGIVDEGISQITESELRFMVNNWFIGVNEEVDWSESVLPVVVVLMLSLGVWLWSFKRREK